MDKTIKKYLMAFIAIAVIARLLPVLNDTITEMTGEGGELEGTAEGALLSLVLLLAVVGILLLSVRVFFK